MRKVTYLVGLFVFCLIIGRQLYQKFYAYETYPNGKIKRSVIFQVLDNRYKFKEFYETGEIKKVYYTIDDKFVGQSIEYFPTGELNSIGIYKNGLEWGDFLTFRKDGKLFVINKYKEGRNYYRKKYIYNSEGSLVDSVYTLFPIIYTENRASDSVFYKVGIITEGLDISCSDVDLIYELYEYKNPDGLFPYTPSHVALLKDCEAQDLVLSTKPDMIKHTDIKSDSLYFFVLVRDKVDGKIHENDPVIIPMKS